MWSERCFLDVASFQEQIQEIIEIMQTWKRKNITEKEESWIDGYCQGLQYASELAVGLAGETPRM